MSEKKDIKTTKKSVKKPIKAAEKPKNSGQFQRGNEIGKETRFQLDNILANKYDEKYCIDIINYFSIPKCEIIYERSYYKDGTIKSEKPIVLPPKFPTLELFAASINVTSRTLLNWCEKYPRFSEAYAYAKNIQLGIAKTYGVSKQYDSNFTKFVLVNDHDMTDKSAIENSQDKPFEVNINVRKK